MLIVLIVVMVLAGVVVLMAVSETVSTRSLVLFGCTSQFDQCVSQSPHTAAIIMRYEMAPPIHSPIHSRCGECYYAAASH